MDDFFYSVELNAVISNITGNCYYIGKPTDEDIARAVIGYGDFIYDVQDVLDDLANQHMIDRDGDPTPAPPPVTKEPDPDARGKGLGLANRYSKPNNFGRYWLK